MRQTSKLYSDCVLSLGAGAGSEQAVHYTSLWRGTCVEKGTLGIKELDFARDVMQAAVNIFELPGKGRIVLYSGFAAALGLAGIDAGQQLRSDTPIMLRPSPTSASLSGSYASSQPWV